jgi:hypothetical protein
MYHVMVIALIFSWLLGVEAVMFIVLCPLSVKIMSPVGFTVTLKYLQISLQMVYHNNIIVAVMH